jgi:hypothetical protein
MNEAERLQRAMKNKVTSSIGINQVRETAMEDLVTEPALADSTGILEAPIPICLLKVFNDMWYTPSPCKAATTHDSHVIELAKAAKVSWELPWPNTMGGSSE